MGKNYWSKKELEIVNNHFAISKWEELLKMIPDKSEQQIISKANKLGLKREKEIIEVYYDEEKEAWVEKSISYNGSKFIINSIIPAPIGSTFEETMDKLSKRVTKIFMEMHLIPKYLEFLNLLGIEGTNELAQVFIDMEKELLKNHEKDRQIIIDKYWGNIEKEIYKAFEKNKNS